MRLRANHDSFASRWRQQAGSTLVEAVVAMALATTVLSSMFAATWQARKQLRGTREAVFSSQIIQNRLEEVRSAAWDQINNSNYIKDNVLETSTLFAPALAEIEETVIVEPYPVEAVTPLKVVRDNTGLVTVISNNSFATSHEVLKVTLSTEWTSAVSGAKRSQTTYTIVAHGGITH